MLRNRSQSLRYHAGALKRRRRRRRLLWAFGAGVLCGALLCAAVGLLVYRAGSLPAGGSAVSAPTAGVLAAPSSTPPAEPSSAATLAAAQVTANADAPSSSPGPTASAAVTPPTKSPAATAAEEPAVRQLVVVVASGTRAEVTFYEKAAGLWSEVLKTSGYVGRSGITANKREGDSKTPSGMFPLGFAFGMDRLDTALEYREITDRSYWVDDPASEYYNTWQEGYGGWNSAEKLWTFPKSYRQAVVIEYNTDRVPGRGSAIFLHCSSGNPTSGCVAIPLERMRTIIQRLDPADHPAIIIAGSAAEVSRYGVIDLAD